jgi:uncharacterized OsmC-like protein
MRIKLTRVNEKFEFTGSNESGNKIHLDASKSIGGNETGFRPMQLLLIGLAGCSAIDILNILYKQKQHIDHFSVDVFAERENDVTPSLFKNISLKIIISGNLSEAKLMKAIDLTRDKYCSVYHILKETSTIKYSYEIES